MGVAFNGNADLLSYSASLSTGATKAVIRGTDECSTCGDPERTWAALNFHIVAR